MAIAAVDFSSAATDEIVASASGAETISLRRISLSVPDGGSATLTMGGQVIAATRSDLDIILDGPQKSAIAGTLTLNSTGAVSTSIEYFASIIHRNSTCICVETLANDFGIAESDAPFLTGSRSPKIPTEVNGAGTTTLFGAFTASCPDGTTQRIYTHATVGNDGNYCFRGL